MAEIQCGYCAGLLSNQILSQMHIDNPDILFGPYEIYNAKASINHKNLDAKTPIQALINHLHTFSDWHMAFKKNAIDQITHLFISHSNLYSLLRVNLYIFIMDCTYKTNWFKFLLLIICSITSLNTTFYVEFAFQFEEKEENYTWSLTQLQNLLITLNLSDSHVIITDTETALINTLSVVFPAFRNLLCLWHINKNILSYIKKETHFLVQKKLNAEDKKMTEIEEVMTCWYGVLYTTTVENYHEA